MTPKSGSFQEQGAPLVAERFRFSQRARHGPPIYVRDPALIFIINGEVIRGEAHELEQRFWRACANATIQCLVAVPLW